jgi:hypothetical protein
MVRDVADEIERQDTTYVKDDFFMTAKPMDTNRCSSGKKVNYLKALNYSDDAKGLHHTNNSISFPSSME